MADYFCTFCGCRHEPLAHCDPFTDQTKEGIFRSHSCWACNDGEKPCRQGEPHRCEYPHARND